MEDKYSYREFLELYPLNGEFDTTKIVKLIQELAPYSFQDQFSPQTWILCFSDRERSYAKNYLESTNGNVRPGCPIMQLASELVGVAASYDDDENVKFREALNDLAKKFEIEIFDEEGKRFEVNFSRYPKMTSFSSS